MPEAPWGVKVLEEAKSHSSSSGWAVRQIPWQPQASTTSQCLGHQAGSFWKLPGTRLVLLEASRLPGQALLRGSYISLSPLATADPLRPVVADPSQEHSRPSSLCSSSLTSSRSLTPTSEFFSASVAASQYGVSPCVSYRGAAGFGFRSLISTAIVCVHYEQKNHKGRKRVQFNRMQSWKRTWPSTHSGKTSVNMGRSFGSLCLHLPYERG